MWENFNDQFLHLMFFAAMVAVITTVVIIVVETRLSAEADDQDPRTPEE
jgi:hypothetical protein